MDTSRLSAAENLLARITGAGNTIELPPVDQLTAEIKVLTRQTVDNLIEIGIKLIQVKQQLPHGEWGNWVENEVKFSHQQANRLMKLSEECPNSSALRNLNPTKAFALLSMPVEERESFIAQPQPLPSGEVKTVDEMTTRELEKAIKAKRTAEEKAQKSEQEKLLAEKATNEARTLAHELTGTVEKLQQKLADRPEKEVLKVPADYEAIKNQAAESSKLSHSNNDLKNQVEILSSQVKSYQTGKLDEKLSIQFNADLFESNVNDFIIKAAPMVVLAPEYQMASPNYQKKFDGSIRKLEKLLADLRDNMVRPIESKVISIDAEVIDQ
jgi:hypothetical protein